MKGGRESLCVKVYAPSSLAKKVLQKSSCSFFGPCGAEGEHVWLGGGLN